MEVFTEVNWLDIFGILHLIIPGLYLVFYCKPKQFFSWGYVKKRLEDIVTTPKSVFEHTRVS